MHNAVLVASSLVALAFAASACTAPTSSDASATNEAAATEHGTMDAVINGGNAADSANANDTSAPAPSNGASNDGAESPATEPAAAADPGPAPGTCSIQKDSEGFIVRNSGKGSYVAYVPASYDGSPMRAIVGMHGCSDDAANFARWGMNPYDTRKTQTHIGISVGSETGNNKCWSMGNDDDKVLAAVDDLAKCFYIDRARVTVAGFSSGGQLAYRVGLLHADKFAGIAIENSGLYAAGIPASSLLAGAAQKLPIAHLAHASDSVFPLLKVKADWTITKAAGFPLTTSEVAGGHDGASADWVNFLIPASASWVKTQ